MPTYQLWYIRENGEVKGPFPVRVIEDFIAIGRLVPASEISLDRVQWRTVNDAGMFATPVAAQPLADKIELQKRRADERRDTRLGEAYERRLHREAFEEAALKPPGKRSGVIYMTAVVLFLCLAGYVVYLFQPSFMPEFGECDTAPGANVNWTNCNKAGVVLAGANLREAKLRNAIFKGAVFSGTYLDGADLAYSNFTGARLDNASLVQASIYAATLRDATLTHANLSGADLTYAILQGANLGNTILRNAILIKADLREANLAGADLTGARLDQAIWIDGSVCGNDSVARCRTN